jgi:uncharacterized protein YegL
MDEFIPFEQIPFGTDSFADNPQPRCACVLLLDTSSSMGGLPIIQLNEGIKVFKDELLADSLAAKRVEIAIVTFGPVTIESDFQSVSNFYPQQLKADGGTPMGEAIEKGVEMITHRKQEYKSHGIQYFKPWIILITDGAPTDNYDRAMRLITEGEENSSFAFFAIGVQDADMNTLNRISPRRTPQKLQGLKFREFFIWLSGSMKIVSSKNPGVKISLPPPQGWNEV